VSVTKPVAHAASEPTIEFRPGVFRTTLSYDQSSMLCRFQMQAGATIAMHSHAALQNGFIISGMLRFFREDGSEFAVGPGDGYVFGSEERHGSEALEDVDFIEFFAPLRPEYIPE
jgi:quercetin dioxygenase-like cupin family protein